MQYCIQSVHMKLFYLTIKLQSNSHLTYYSYNNQKDLKLNLDRALGGQLIKISYFAEGYKRADWKQQGSADGIGKGGSCLLYLRK
jgi:hypothetical protein